MQEASRRGDTRGVAYYTSRSSEAEKGKAAVLAARHGHREIVLYLVSLGIPNIDEVFHEAAEFNRVNILQDLITEVSRATIARSMVDAARYGNVGAVLFLEAYDPQAAREALREAWRNEQWYVVGELRRLGYRMSE